MVHLKTATEIERIRTSCRIAADAMLAVSEELKPGVTTLYLDQVADQYIRSQNAVANKYLKELAKRAEAGEAAMPAKLTFHIARHSFADLARKAGWDVYAISKALGHAGLAVTEHYLAGFDGDSLDGNLGALFTEEAS